MTYLAVSIGSETVETAAEQIKAAKKAGAEMLELRTDYLADLDVEKIRALLAAARKTALPLLVTCRDRVQGGAAELSPELRTRILVEAIGEGADFIDCEFDNFVLADTHEKIRAALAERPQTGLILSTHDFSGPLTNTAKVFNDIARAEPEAIPKVVYKADHINDCFAAMDLLLHGDRDAIVLCMGPAGLITRVLAKKLGAFATFAALDAAHATAPGQLTVAELKGAFRWDNIGEATEVFGVIGSPVGHSLSPAIFNACFDAQHIDALYLPLLVEGEKPEFDTFLSNIITRGGGGGTGGGLGFGGFSVTIPHKTHALDFINHAGEFVEPLAETIGAVNTLKIGFGGIVSGYNTDYAGAIDALTAAMQIGPHDLHSMKVAVVGAGGAARAVVAGLADVGARVTIYNRTINKARDLAGEFKCRYAALEKLGAMDARVLINCTSIGMCPKVDATPVPTEGLKPDMVVFDTVYNPRQTKLLKEAAVAGGMCISGIEMFIRQAMAQYKICIGQEADEEVIRKTISDRLQITEPRLQASR
ncbi:MAG: shikimate dehydrogenase [Phycisphaerae bacterium]|nr:shikimate dehydrogenase [Phycisphaerae bacterium]